MKYKCPICETAQKYKGVCYDCNLSYKKYKSYVDKDQWIMDRLDVTYSEYGQLVQEYKDTYEKTKNHYDKLEKNRKYTKGNYISTFEELLKQEIVWWYTSPKPIGFILSMQLNTVKSLLIGKKLCYCIEK